MVGAVSAVRSLALVILIGVGSSYGCIAAESAASKLKARLSLSSEIELHLGVNDVEFDAIDRKISPDPTSRLHLEGKIIVAVRECLCHTWGKAYLVTTEGDFENSGSWALTGASYNDGRRKQKEIISDDAQMGEKKFRTVRFFNGSIDGKKTTLLFISNLSLSHLDLETGTARSNIEVFVFSTGEYPKGSFDLVSEFPFREKSCDADAALSMALSVPLPDRLKGRKRNGCFN